MTNALSLLNELADRLKWPQIETIDKPDNELSAHERKLLRLVNRVLQTWCGLSNWPLLRTDGTIVLLAAVKSDASLLQYVTATQNSDVVTLDAMILDDTYKQRAFQVNGDDYVYRIVDVPSPTQIQINRAWISASITTADEMGFTIAQDRYALPDDFDRPADTFESFLSPYHIEPRSPDEFRDRRMRDRGIVLGEPAVYTVYTTNPGETVQLVHFHPYIENARLLQFPYQRTHPSINSDNDKIFVAERFIGALIDVILELAIRDYEDDSKTQQILADMLRQYDQQASNPGVVRALPRFGVACQTRADIRRGIAMGSIKGSGGDSWDLLNWRYDN